MFSKRQNQVSRVLQKELSEVFQRVGGSIISGVLITVTVVRISPDLSVAKAYLSLFPGDEKEEMLDAINNKKSLIRNELGKRIRNQFRKVPELVFLIDDSMDYADNIDRILKD